MSEARPASAGIALEFSDPTMLRGGGIGKFIHPIALCRDGVIKKMGIPFVALTFKLRSNSWG